MPATNGDGNVFLTDDIIVQEALRLLKNNMVYAPLVFRDLEKRFAKVGDQVSMKKPFRTKTASGRTLVKQPLVDQSIAVDINNHEHFGLAVTMRDRTLSIEQFSERYLKSGIVQLANKIDRSIAYLAKDCFYGSGTPGTAITRANFHYAKAYQQNVGVPMDGMNRGVMNNLDSAIISNSIESVYNPTMVKQAIQKGYMGPLSGYDIYESANIYTHTVGAYAGTPLVNGANQTGSTLVTDGWTSGSSTLNKGDTFTIAGVYEINPQTYQSTGRLMRFTVTTQISDTSGAKSISISPSINDGTLTTTDGEGNTVSLAAYQNVSNAPADDAAITVIGTASTEYRENTLFHRDAFALVMVDLELPESATVKARVRDEDSGLSLSMTGGYDINNHEEITRIDAVWGVKTIYPELAHRMWSDEASVQPS
jgi:hypothetical protein